MATEIYRVKHGDWCPIPEGFTEAQCIFVPVGYKFTESYTLNNSYDSRQGSRWVGGCDIYFAHQQGRDGQRYSDANSHINVGINKTRRAVVESYNYSEWTSSNDAGNTYESYRYRYGELTILCIAKK